MRKTFQTFHSNYRTFIHFRQSIAQYNYRNFKENSLKPLLSKTKIKTHVASSLSKLNLQRSQARYEKYSSSADVFIGANQKLILQKLNNDLKWVKTKSKKIIKYILSAKSSTLFNTVIASNAIESSTR